MLANPLMADLGILDDARMALIDGKKSLYVLRGSRQDPPWRKLVVELCQTESHLPRNGTGTLMQVTGGVTLTRSNNHVRAAPRLPETARRQFAGVGAPHTGTE